MSGENSVKENRFSWIRWAAWGYIALPFLFFLLGWVKWYIAVPAVLLVAFAIIWKADKADARFPILRKEDRKKLLIAAVLILGWVVLAGIGGLVFQNTDHRYRNELFRMLVERSWPIRETVEIDGTAQPVFLSYYIAFWLPSALVGKAFGLEAGFIFQIFWAALGIFLVSCEMSRMLKRWSVSALVIFILFSGLDVIGCIAMKHFDYITDWQRHMELWCGFQFSSHTTQLFWVFNQAIYGWLLTLMILNEKSNRKIVLIWSFGLMACTFPFVGMLPFLVYRILANWKQEASEGQGSAAEKIKGLFTVENVLAGGTVGILSFLYLGGNASANNVEGGQTFFYLGYFLRVFAFVLLEAGVYHLAVCRYQWKNPLFWITLGTLLACPFVRIGGGIDFCMRASIPALLVLCVLVIDSLQKAREKKCRWNIALICAVLVVGCVTPAHEFIRTIARTNGAEREYIGAETVLSEPNFASPADGSLFIKYLAK